jgi:precorrin isomerase
LFYQESLEEHCNGLKNLIIDKLVNCYGQVDFLELLRKSKGTIGKITDAVRKET